MQQNPMASVSLMNNSSRMVSPPKDQLLNLRTPLTPGELKVFEFFDKHLRPEWEIYIQPHLNGLRPDFVLLNPRVGIAVYEVKDWNLSAMSAMQYYVEADDSAGTPRLKAFDGNHHFSKQTENPVEKVYRYKREIFELYCPRLAEKSGLGMITAGIIFPFAPIKSIIEVFSKSLEFRGMTKQSRFYPVIGCEALTGGEINAVLPENKWPKSDFMSDKLAKDLRCWLVEPDFASEQRIVPELDSKQRQYATTRTSSGYRRITGPAGSGKSLVLAKRAAELIKAGKRVLVVTYNITLWHYLKDLTARFPHAPGDICRDITWLNFHSWCRRVCEDAGFNDEYRRLWSHTGEHIDGNAKNKADLILLRVLNDDLPALVNWVMDVKSQDVVKYDAILVDEGQDYLPSWWNTLRRACEAEGEMLLAADATQDIYETAKAWTDVAMLGAGFHRINWVRFDISYRLPPAVLRIAADFAGRYLDRETITLPHLDTGNSTKYPCKLKWLQVDKDGASDVCLDAILKMPIDAKAKELAFPDITLLTPNQHVGGEVVKKAEESRNVRSVHTYSADKKEARRLKLGFFMGDARIKATTLHSFKGWETRALVIYTGHVLDKQALALIYTGLTRIKRHTDGSFLTVVCAIPKLAEFGQQWFEYIDMTSQHVNELSL